MDFSDYHNEARLHELWNSVSIARNIHYTLFTFGISDLEYYLVLKPTDPDQPVKIRQGEIKIDRPLLITPQNAQPEFKDFFEEFDENDLVQFLMSRTAAFSNLRLSNLQGSERIVTDQVEEVVDHLNQKLDSEQEDRIAILVAPENLAGMALFRYAAERIMASAPENVTELREKGFLP